MSNLKMMMFVDKSSKKETEKKIISIYPYRKETVSEYD